MKCPRTRLTGDSPTLLECVKSIKNIDLLHFVVMFYYRFEIVNSLDKYSNLIAAVGKIKNIYM